MRIRTTIHQKVEASNLRARHTYRHKGCSISLIEGRFTMIGPRGIHSISSNSSDESVTAHWEGFTANNSKLEQIA